MCFFSPYIFPLIGKMFLLYLMQYDLINVRCSGGKKNIFGDNNRVEGSVLVFNNALGHFC